MRTNGFGASAHGTMADSVRKTAVASALAAALVLVLTVAAPGIAHASNGTQTAAAASTASSDARTADDLAAELEEALAEAGAAASPDAQAAADAPSADSADIVPAADLARSVANGICGDNIAWYLDGDGTLHLMGTGATYNYTKTASAFAALSDDVRNAVVDEGITSLGDFVFCNLASMETCTLPDTLQGIGTGAFAYCMALEAIEVPAGVTQIGLSAFWNCKGLYQVDLANTKIGTVSDSMFTYCCSLASIELPATVTSIGTSAFRECTALTRVDVTAPAEPSTGALRSIGDRACENCYSLETFDLPEGLQTIGASAFLNCNWLCTGGGLVFPETLRSIGTKAFMGCTGLTGTVKIPAAVESIGAYAFDDCYYVEAIEVAAENANYSAADGVLFSKDGTVLIRCPEGHAGAEGTGSYTVPDGVTRIAEYAFYDCALLTEIQLPESGLLAIDKEAFHLCTAITEMELPEGITCVNDIFTRCDSLQKVSLPASAAYVTPGVFEDCDSLVEVDVAAGNPCYQDVNGILFSADGETLECFPQAKARCEYAIPETVTRIQDYAFYGCDALTTLTIPQGVEEIGESALQNCSGLTELALPAGLTTIGQYAFSGCSALEELLVPDTVTSLGEGVFDTCSALRSVELPARLAYGSSLGTEMFHMCTSLESVTVPAGVTSIGDYAFAFCGNLQTVTLPDGLKTIGENAFMGCEELRSLDLPDTVSSIGAMAFERCRSLTSIALPAGLTQISAQAFSSCEGLEEIVVPEGVVSIGDWAFEYCTGLRRVVLPSTVNAVGEGIFYECVANGEPGILSFVIGTPDASALTLGTGVFDAVNRTDGIVFADNAVARAAAEAEGLAVAAVDDEPYDIASCTIVWAEDVSGVVSVSNGARTLTAGVSYTVKTEDETVTVTGCGAYGGQVQKSRPQPGPTPTPEPVDPATRIAGENRYETAAAIALEAYPAGSEAVIVASGEGFADALCASGLAGVLECPIVLTPADELSEYTAAAIAQLQSRIVYVIGGSSAVSTDVTAVLREMEGVDNVVRIAGDNRYETAFEVFDRVAGSGGWGGTAVIATGESYPDALSISAFTAANAAPVILVDENGVLSGKTRTALAEYDFEKVIIVGGTAAVPANVDENIEALLGTEPIRLAGGNRYGTSLAIAEYLVDEGLAQADGACIASGTRFADALAGGPLAGTRGTVMLLATDDDTRTFGVLENAGVERISVLGGVKAVSDAVFDAAKKAAGLA